MWTIKTVNAKILILIRCLLHNSQEDNNWQTDMKTFHLCLLLLALNVAEKITKWSK